MFWSKNKIILIFFLIFHRHSLEQSDLQQQRKTQAAKKGLLNWKTETAHYLTLIIQRSSSTELIINFTKTPQVVSATFIVF